MQRLADPHVTVHVADARTVLHHPSVVAAEERMIEGVDPSSDTFRQMVARRVLLRMAVGAARPTDVAITAGPCLHCGGDHGRLQVETSQGESYFASVSGGGRYVAAVTSRDSYVGVDVEDRPAAQEHLPTDDLLLHPDDDETGDRLRLWVRKEALLKTTGEGLRTPMESFAASGQDIGPYRGVSLTDLPVEQYPDALVSVGALTPGRPTVDLHTR